MYLVLLQVLPFFGEDVLGVTSSVTFYEDVLGVTSSVSFYEDVLGVT